MNISDEIVEIESEAFADAQVKSVIWSAGCKTIPEYCFSGSEIKTIKNIEKVETIGKYAFAECSNLNNLDLSSTGINSIGKGAFFGVDRAKIRFPYYMGDEMLDATFNLK
ncbi:MAG: leucine-rich repeat domain-containing protein [Eubacterium sp.]|nr:leucine-rich repeat domain-containing protein [Eubacterium sp.]